MSGPTICHHSQTLLVRVPPNLLSLILVLSLFTLPPSVYTQSNASPGPAAAQSVSVQNLELARPIEREISGGEVHPYNLILTADQYVRFDVDQRGIDLAVWIFDPKGKKISEQDAFRVGEQEQVGILAEISGAYRVEVHTSFPKGPSGRYEIKIKELRPATEHDKISNKAGALIDEAFELERKQTKEDWRKAIAKYEEAMPTKRLTVWPERSQMAKRSKSLPAM